MGNASHHGPPTYVARGHDFKDTSIYVLDSLMNLISKIPLNFDRITAINVINRKIVLVQWLPHSPSILVNVYTGELEEGPRLNSISVYILGERYVIDVVRNEIIIHDTSTKEKLCFDIGIVAFTLAVIDVNTFASLHAAHVRIQQFNGGKLYNIREIQLPPLDFTKYRKQLEYIGYGRLLVGDPNQVAIIDVNTANVRYIAVAPLLNTCGAFLWRQDVRMLTTIDTNTLTITQKELPENSTTKKSFGSTDDLIIVENHKTIRFYSIQTDSFRVLPVDRVVKDIIHMNSEYTYITTQSKVGKEFRQYREPRNLMDKKARVYSRTTGKYTSRPAYRNVKLLRNELNELKMPKTFGQFVQYYFDVIFYCKIE